MNAIEITNLKKNFPGFSLDIPELILPSGCILGLIGENGAGKSTTIKLILQLLHQDSGTIRLLGRDNAEALALTKQDIGVVLDEVGIPSTFKLTQVERIMRGVFQDWDSEVFWSLSRRFHLPEDKRFKALSRGTKMKLGLAIALSHHPKLLILDEATSGLDPVVRDEILDIFLEFTRDETHSILISSHIVSDLDKLCDYIAFLHQGRLLLYEEKDTLREEYGILHCSAEELSALAPEAVYGKKQNPYGVEALVKRDALPAGMAANPVDIEQLFIYMVKEDT